MCNYIHVCNFYIRIYIYIYIPIYIYIYIYTYPTPGIVILMNSVSDYPLSPFRESSRIQGVQQLWGSAWSAWFLSVTDLFISHMLHGAGI